MNRLFYAVLLMLLWSRMVAFSPDLLINQPEKKLTLQVDVSAFILHPEAYLPDMITGSTLNQSTVKHSLTATHYHWQQFVNGVVVVGTYVTAHAVGSNQIQLHFRLINSDWVTPPFQPGADAYWASGGALIPVKIEHRPDNTVEYRSVENSRLIHSTIHKHAFSDSLVTRVFKPNPILSAEQPYGPPYVDNNDSNNQALTDELFWVKLPAIRVNDTLFLSDTQFISKEISIPNVPVPFVVNSDTAWTDRSKSDFEQLNVFFHLIQERDYLHKLGFSHLIQDTLFVDGQSGFSDNSYFFVSNQDGSRNLEFGTGGIDDGEDADVVIHEYGHYLLEQAVGWKPILTGDAGGMNEGNCDYLAKAYALTFSDFKADELYTWDGNAFGWDGVQVRNDKTYEQVSGNLLNDREIWVRPWMCIYDALGRETTDSLFLEHLSYFTTGMSMPTAARITLQIDTLLFDGEHSFTIRKCFCESKMLTPNECVVGIESVSQLNQLEVLNSVGFLAGNGNLILQSTSSSPILQVKLFDVRGRELNHWNTSGFQVEISPNALPVGMYWAHVYLENGVQIVKFIR